MKHNATQRERVIHDSTRLSDKSQLLIDLKRRVLDCRQRLLDMGAHENYLPFCMAQAAREGRKLDATERKAIGQIMNLRVYSNDVERVEFIERSIKAAA